MSKFTSRAALRREVRRAQRRAGNPAAAAAVAVAAQQLAETRAAKFENAVREIVAVTSAINTPNGTTRKLARIANEALIDA